MVMMSCRCRFRARLRIGEACRYCGNGADGDRYGAPCAFAVKRCQSSSVRNGITGWSSRRAVSKTASMLHQSVIEAGVFREAELLQLDVPVAELVQKNCQTRLRGFVITVHAMARLTCSAQAFRRLKIQRSSRASPWWRHRVGPELFEAVGNQGSTPERSMFMKRKRAAFQILLAKARRFRGARG